MKAATLPVQTLKSCVLLRASAAERSPDGAVTISNRDRQQALIIIALLLMHT